MSRESTTSNKNLDETYQSQPYFLLCGIRAYLLQTIVAIKLASIHAQDEIYTLNIAVTALCILYATLTQERCD